MGRPRLVPGDALFGLPQLPRVQWRVPKQNAWHGAKPSWHKAQKAAQGAKCVRGWYWALDGWYWALDGWYWALGGWRNAWLELAGGRMVGKGFGGGRVYLI